MECGVVEQNISSPIWGVGKPGKPVATQYKHIYSQIKYFNHLSSRNARVCMLINWFIWPPTTYVTICSSSSIFVECNTTDPGGRPPISGSRRRSIKGNTCSGIKTSGLPRANLSTCGRTPYASRFVTS